MGIFGRRKSADASEAAQTTGAAGVEIRDAFTDLAAAIVANPAGPATGEFWKAVYQLQTWHFLPGIPPGERIKEHMTSGRSIAPMVVRMDGRRYVLAFTSEQRAAACATINGFTDGEQGGIALLSMPLDAAASYLCRLEDDAADGVLFNHNRGEHGMTAPLDNIAAMYEYYLDSIPAPMFDRFVRSVTAADSPHAWARLNRRLVSMQRWFFIGDAKRPQSPQLFMHEGQVCALLFTDEEHAARGSRALGGAGDAGRVPLIPTTPRDASAFLGLLRQHSAEQGHPVSDIIFNLGSRPFTVAIDDLSRFLAM